MPKIEMTKKVFLLLVFGTLALGVITGVLVGSPGWILYGIQMERQRIKSIAEIGGEFRKNREFLEERLGPKEFHGKQPKRGKMTYM